MCKIDPLVRLSANNNGETKCVIFVDSCDKARKSLEKFTSRIVAAYPFIEGFGAYINVHKISDLSSLECVRAVASHTTVTTKMNAVRDYLSIQNSARPEIYGENIGVAVIDTGIRPHLDFVIPKNRVQFFDFIDGKKDMYDDNGHGTAVSSIACGSGFVSGGKFAGVAPKANIISLKAISSNGEGGAFAILEAMQWIYENHKKYNIRIVCMSFGANPVINGLDPLSVGAEALWKSGIVVVSSAGNDGPSPSTIKSPGCNPYIITVGGAEINSNSIKIANFSSRGPAGNYDKPDIVAPAVDIACCGINSDYIKLSGTSMAAPIVAGAAALLLSVNSDLTPSRVKEILLENAIPLGLSRNESGYGLISFDFLNI